MYVPHSHPAGRMSQNDKGQVSDRVNRPSINSVALPCLHPIAARMVEDMLALYFERGVALIADLERQGYTKSEIQRHRAAAQVVCASRIVRQIATPSADRVERIEQAVHILMELPAADLVSTRRGIQIMALQNRNFTKPELDDILADVLSTLEARVFSLFQGAA